MTSVHGPPPGPPFESFPAPPAGSRPARPGRVEAAFWVAVAAALLVTALHAVSSVLVRDFLAAAVGAAAPPEAVEVIVGVSSVVAVALLALEVVLTALWIAFGLLLRAGRRWARVVLSVFAAIWAVYSVGGLITGGSGLLGGLAAGNPTPPGILALGYAQIALGLLAAVAFLALVHGPTANRYFEAGRR
ncbi:hypothetical protein ACL03H_19560 [Saccharopolyspora sp. MS10]|uniref:hypothetical protein n=1 Tax=Saccharopolyspora sp. MS10 TaxID=3385973 RepID=UPI0039A3D126